MIPCYNSAKTLPIVVEEIDNEFKCKKDFEYEIILVNDGSPDSTYEVINDICKKNNRIMAINLSQNFGQSGAKMAAVSFIHGDILITMDDDGQHPAKGIFVLIDKILEGYDMVYALFSHKKHSLFKRVTSNLNGIYFL